MSKSKRAIVGTLAVLLVLGGAALFVGGISTDDFADSSPIESIGENPFEEFTADIDIPVGPFVPDYTDIPIVVIS